MKSIFISVIFTLIATTGIGQNKAYIETEKAVADINYMIKTIEEIHYNPYFKTSKEQFNQYKTDLLSTFNKDSISLKRFVTTGMKLSALMSGGHTSMDWQTNNILPELMEYKFIPFTGKLSNNSHRLIVTRSASQNIKKGSVITSINGIDVSELYKECMSYIGGIESFKKEYTEQVFPLYLFFTDKVSAPYTVKLSNTDKDIELPGLDISGLNTLINQNQEKENYIFDIVQGNIGLITYNSCTDYDAFKIFLKETFTEIKTKNINKLIIDIRENSGGNSSLNDLLLTYITTKPYRQSSGRYWKVSNQAKTSFKNNPEYEELFGKDFIEKYEAAENQSIIESFDDALMHPTKPENYFIGKTCVLIGPSTFSSANFLADAIKTFKLSTLIGSATGELTNDFGEQINFALPNSGNYVYVSSTYDIGANGNPDIFEPVYPDIETNKDALEYALDWIK
ncbi:S41 family peptidase [Bizionia sp. KMM 8389]